MKLIFPLIDYITADNLKGRTTLPPSVQAPIPLSGEHKPSEGEIIEQPDSTTKLLVCSGAL